MIKSNRARSTARKPLVDISNGGKPSRIPKKKSATDDVDGGASLDHLLLARSELSNLFGQIDELVAQALENKRIDRRASRDIESFRKVLCDVHSFLKPWISRLRQAFSSSLTADENQLARTNDTKSASHVNKNEVEDVLSFKNETDLDLMVSPSPLVSWRVGARAGAYALETGKQLFLLTPLPKSLLAPTKSTVKVLCDKNQHATLEPAQSASDALLETTKKEIPSANEPKPSIAGANHTCNLGNDKNNLKSSPPAVFDPPATSDSKGSDGFTDDALKDLTSRYQELLGLKPSDNFTHKRKEVNLTLDWFLSPPKTCLVMEPTDEKPLPTPANNGMLFLATPCNNLESTVHTGKRAGESTLKKELWNRFEEVSKDGLHFDASVFKKAERKGFLDMLEEACEASDSECGDGK